MSFFRSVWAVVDFVCYSGGLRCVGVWVFLGWGWGSDLYFWGEWSGPKKHVFVWEKGVDSEVWFALLGGGGGGGGGINVWADISFQGPGESQVYVLCVL